MTVAGPSLRGRLLRALALTQLAVFLVMSGLYLRAEWRGETQQRYEELSRIAAVFAAALHDPDHAPATIDLPDWIDQKIAAGAVSILVSSHDGRPLYNAGPAMDPPPLIAMLESEGRGDDPDQPWLWRRIVRADASQLWVTARGASTSGLWSGWLKSELIGELGPMLAVFLVASLSVSWLSVRRDLRPVARLSAAAAALRPGEDGRRLDPADAPREIAPLIQAMNLALARAEEAVTRQRRLVADAAHELRTPLAVLQARLDGGVLDATALRRDLAGLSRLVGQLLAKGRSEAAPLDDGVDLVAAARRCVADLFPEAWAAGRELALIAPDPSPPLMRADPDGLAAAIRNLIENAVAFTPQGEVIEVEVTAEGALWVRDRGPGIAPEHLPRLFEPFWRAPGQRRPGAGLGLAIVAEAAARAGFRVAAENRPDGGAAFGLVPDRIGEG